MRTHHRPSYSRAQDGIALVIVLILMGAVFLMAAVGARMGLLGEKASRNDRDRQIAFQAAEAALSDAEIDIMGPNSAANSRTCSLSSSENMYFFIEGCGSADGVRGLCQSVANSSQPLYKSINFEDTSSSRRYVLLGEYTGGRNSGFAVSSSNALPAQLPRYIVEQIPYQRANSSNEKAFLITAIGYGVNQRTQVMLQSVAYKPATAGC